MDVAALIIAVIGWLVVMYMLYSAIRRLWAKAYARKITPSDKGNLKLVVWSNTRGMTETLMVFTTIPMIQHNAIIRAVHMWGIVRRKQIIEIKIPSQDEIIYRTY